MFVAIDWIFAFRFFTLPCRLDIVLVSATIVESLVDRWFAYSAIFAVRVRFVSVRFVTAAPSSTVAWERMVDNSLMPTQVVGSVAALARRLMALS